ncbi:unnamed protein product [Ceutorhynchus assimilis]|uniref:Major sperm protein n=1 Tax=Ceutorhynchus assimilis TaxID=467358 RepID=A0A9N9MWL8_9CUCU|nr:unnamed protein product [Ceutorhynchus assimilis]
MTEPSKEITNDKKKSLKVAKQWIKSSKDGTLSRMDASIKSTYSKSFQGFMHQLDKEIQARFPDVTYLYHPSPIMSKDHFTTMHEIEHQGKEPPNENPVTFHGIKIDPGCMIFKDAYDGKSYRKTVTITNCRRKIVTVRISEPTSKAFKMKPLPIGQVLSPGLSVVRHIKYLYTKPTAIPQACMDIYIDNEYFGYDLIV